MPTHSKSTGSSRDAHTDAFALRNRLRKWTVQLRQRWWLLLAIVAGCTFAGGGLGLPAAAGLSLDGADGDGREDRRARRGDLLRGVDLLPGDAGGVYEKRARCSGGRRNAWRAHAPDSRPAPVELNVAPEQNTTIFNLSAVGSNPAYTQQYLGSGDDGVRRDEAGRCGRKSPTITRWRSTRNSKRLKTEIAQGEEELVDFQKKNNIGFLEEQGNSAADYLVTLNRSLANLKNEYQLLQSLDLDTGLDQNQKHDLMVMALKDRAAAAAPAKGEPAGLDNAKSEAAEAQQTGAEAEVRKGGAGP